MGTTAHVRITTPDGSPAATVLHRFDGDTVGERLRTFAEAVASGTITVAPLTPETLAAAWRNHQDQRERDTHARLARGGARDAEMFERLLVASTEVHPEDLDFDTLGLEYGYTILIDGRQALTITDRQGRPGWSTERDD